MIGNNNYNEEFDQGRFEKSLLENKAFSGVNVAYDEIDKAISDYNAIYNMPGEKSEKNIVALEVAVSVLKDLKISIFNEMNRRVLTAKRFAEDLNDTDNR